MGLNNPNAKSANSISKICKFETDEEISRMITKPALVRAKARLLKRIDTLFSISVSFRFGPYKDVSISGIRSEISKIWTKLLHRPGKIWFIARFPLDVSKSQRLYIQDPNGAS